VGFNAYVPEPGIDRGCSYPSYLAIEGWPLSRNVIVISDPLRDNPAHPAKINFLLEAIIVTKVTI